MMSAMALRMLWGDAVGQVVGDLLGTAPLGLVYGPAHGAGHLVGVEDGLSLCVAGRAADGLDQGPLRAQKALLVGVEDGDQRHLRHVEPLAQQIDAHQDVELTQAQVADDLHPLDGVDVRVQVAHPHPVVGQVVGQVLCHAFGQGGDQDSGIAGDPGSDLG
jgi:hypothetical protein